MLIVRGDFMGVGENIRAARQRAKLTQKQLGELCGIAEPTIRRYELNKLNPNFDTIAKIASALGVSAAKLMSYDWVNAGYWTERFRRGLSIVLQNLNKSDSNGASFDFESAVEIAEGCIGFSFEDACQIASDLGTTVDDLIAVGAKEIAGDASQKRAAGGTPDSSE